MTQQTASHPYDWAYAKLNLQRPMAIAAGEAVLGLTLDDNSHLVARIDQAAKRLAIRDKKFRRAAELPNASLLTLAKSNLLSDQLSMLLAGWDRPNSKQNRFYQVDRQDLLRRPLEKLNLEDLARFTLGTERIELSLEILLFTLAQKNWLAVKRINPAEKPFALQRPAPQGQMKLGV